MSLIAELKQALYDLPLASQPDRKDVAHFCQHDGICIRYTRARTLWHAVMPLALKPWWLILEPLKIRQGRETSCSGESSENEHSSNQDTNHNNKNENVLEVEKNA